MKKNCYSDTTNYKLEKTKNLFFIEKNGEPLSKDSQLASFRAAFCEIDITPNVSVTNPVLLQGMAGQPRIATAVSHPLKMQILLLEDKFFTKVLLVTADLFGFSSEMVKQLRDAACVWGIENEGVILNASHTHYAPGTISNISTLMGPYYYAYARQITQIIKQKIPQLYHGLQNCTISCGRVKAQIGVNRRLAGDGTIHFAPNVAGIYDQHTPFLLIDFTELKRNVLLVNHGCHPTGLGKENLISSDYPGYLRDEIISSKLVNGVMFLQGAGGSSKESIQVADNFLFCNSTGGSQENGKKLAKKILAKLKQHQKQVSGSIFCTKRHLRLPLKPIAGYKLLEKVRSDPLENPMVREWAAKLLSTSPENKFPSHLLMEAQFVSLGDNILFISFPAEPVAELSSKILRLLGIPEHTFTLGYTNGLNGYLPTDKMIKEGGYEVEDSHIIYQAPSALDKGTETAVLDSVKEFLIEKDRQNTANGYGRYHLAKGEKEAFFVLSAGRCGTMTLAHLLNTARNARVWHHPQPDLIAESRRAYSGGIDKKRTFWRARYSLLHKTWADQLIYGETDLLMTPFCDMLAKEIPNSKFIVLVRDPKDFIRSGMRRNYYQGHPWDFGRLRPEENTEAHEKWKLMSQFEKICWLWNATYERILQLTDSIDQERLMLVRFEDLVHDINQTKAVFDFLKLEGFEKTKVEDVLGKRLNAQIRGKFPRSDQWSDELLLRFQRQCGSLPEKFGYASANSLPGQKVSSIQPISVWDYKKFKHEEYPSNIDSRIFTQNQFRTSLIHHGTKIVSMGSCFARNIALHFLEKKYNYLVTEHPFRQSSAHWGQVFNTTCMRQIFEYTFNHDWLPLIRWWPKGNLVQDPFRRNILYNKESCELDFEKHRKASFRALSKADIVILTLGLIETWCDRRDRMTYYRVPSPAVYSPKIHEFYVQKVKDCVKDLNTIRGLLKANNPGAQIILTVSPIPMFATFRTDMNVIAANMHSKATLRVAAEYFSQQYENVFYFPAFEIITQAIPNPYEADNRHVTKEAIDEVMKIFETLYVDRQNPVFIKQAGEVRHATQ